MRALLVVHGYDPITGAPSVPARWTVELCGNADAPWYCLMHPTGRMVFAYRENEHAPSSQALWCIVGEADDLADLAAIVDEDMPARAAWRRRDEPAVRTFLRRWRTLRCDGFTRDPETGDPVAFTNEVKVLIPRGAQLPDWSTSPPPWNLDADGRLTTATNAVIRVTGFAGVNTLALANTLAGHRYDQAFADEPDT